MKNFVLVTTLVLFLLGIVLAISAFLGRDLVSVLKDTVRLGSNQAKEGKLGKVITKFAVISDTHSDSLSTERAVAQAKSLGIDYLIDTGDWTTVGTIAELSTQKKILDKSGLTYWGVMGDHDRWQSGPVNFEKVFGAIYESFDRNGIHHILLDASDLTEGFGKVQLDWLENDLKKAKEKPVLIFMHLPPYDPVSDRTLALKGGKSAFRDEQTARFFSLIKDKKVIAIFAGDHHLSASYTEPQTGVKIFVVGAVTRERNLQSPRFDLVKIDENYNIAVEEQVINVN